MLDVDGAAYLLLDGHHPIKGVAIACIRDDQHIDIAMRGFRPFGYRSENQRYVDWQSFECSLNDVGYAKGFPCEAAQLFENRTLSIGLEFMEIASRNLGDNPDIDKRLDFPLNR